MRGAALGSTETNSHDRPKDRATVVATTLITIITRALRDPTLQQQVAAMLRDEFDDVRHQALSENKRD
jgi:hypothetical protein